MALPAEILKKVKLLELKTRKLVNNLFAGEYHSAFRGQGMTFSEFREYVPGDDVRAISWTATARTGRTIIKKYDEERELTVYLVVDVSGSTEFGTNTYFKGETMTHLSALLSYSAQRNGDPVGLVLFSDQVEHFVPAKKGPGQIQRIIRDLYYCEPKSIGTSIANCAEHLLGVLKKRSHIFIFSDFLDENFEDSLRALGRKHDVIAVCVQDPFELELPKVGLLNMEDPETGETFVLDTSSPIVRREFAELSKSNMDKRDSALRRSRVDRIDVVNGENIVDPLIKFFKRRAGR